MKRILHRVATWLNRVGLANKLVIITVILCAIPVVIISIVLNGQIETRIQSEQNLYYDREVDRYILSLNSELTTFNDFASRLAADQYIIDTIKEIHQTSLSGAYPLALGISDYLGRQMNNFPKVELKTVMLYSDNATHPAYAVRVSTMEAVKRDGWLTGYEEKPPVNTFFRLKGRTPDGDFLCMMKPIYDLEPGAEPLHLGYIKMDLILDRCFSNEWSFDNHPYSMYITMEGSEGYLYTENPQLYKLDDFNAPDALEALPDGNYVDDNVMCAKRSMDNFGLKVYMLIDNSDMVAQTQQVLWVLWVTGILLILLTVVLARGTSHLLVKRIDQLVRKMDAVKDGNLEIGSEIDGNDEIAKLDQNFNSMVAMLKKQIEENYIQSHLILEAEFNALKFQINPHFLFNTLETINAIAAVRDVPEISMVSQKLGEMLQYSLNVGFDQPVPLRRELTHIKNYFFIQKVRFDDRFEVEYDIPKSLANMEMLQFILQPIVENVLKHCIDGSEETCTIHICGREQGCDLLIEVEDDGPGMDAEMLEKLNASFASGGEENIMVFAQQRGIGLKNVHMRIRLHYGEGYGLRVESRPGQGTRVSIRIPKDKFQVGDNASLTGQ